jgi:hypothetical protein
MGMSLEPDEVTDVPFDPNEGDDPHLSAGPTRCRRADRVLRVLAVWISAGLPAHILDGLPDDGLGAGRGSCRPTQVDLVMAAARLKAGLRDGHLHA